MIICVFAARELVKPLTMLKCRGSFSFLLGIGNEVPFYKNIFHLGVSGVAQNKSQGDNW